MVDEFGRSPVNERFIQAVDDREKLNNLVASLMSGEYYMMKTVRDLVDKKLVDKNYLVQYKKFNDDLQDLIGMYDLNSADISQVYELNIGLDPRSFSDEQLGAIEEAISKMKKIYIELKNKGYSDDLMGVMEGVAGDE